MSWENQRFDFNQGQNEKDLEIKILILKKKNEGIIPFHQVADFWNHKYSVVPVFFRS